MRISRLRQRLRGAPVAIGWLAVAVAGCGYSSQYAAPVDGRARAVWHEDGVRVELAGAAPTRACTDEVGRLSGGQLQVGRAAGERSGGGGGYWVPRYYGSPIVVVHAGIAPPLLRPPVFLPRLAFGPTPFGVPVVRVGGGGGGLDLGKLGGGGGGGGGDGAGYLLLVLAAIALIVLPAVDLWMAIDNPTSSADASRVIDWVNTYNDLARWPGSPCVEWAS